MLTLVRGATLGSEGVVALVTGTVRTIGSDGCEVGACLLACKNGCQFVKGCQGWVVTVKERSCINGC